MLNNLFISTKSFFRINSKYAYFVFLLLPVFVNAQKTDAHLSKILYKNKKLRAVLNQSQNYGIQIIYTHIDGNVTDKPIFQSYFYNYDSTRYFYPASTVKFPAALLAFEKLERLGIQGLTAETAMFNDSEIAGYEPILRDSTAPNGWPSVDHYAKKIFLVSDNDAFNRLYDFLGQDEFNQKLIEKGYLNTRINHRLSIALSPEQNATMPALRFYNLSKESPIPHKEELAVLKIEKRTEIPEKYKSPTAIPLAKGYKQNDELINEPMDFAGKNRFDLMDQQRMLKAFLFPNAVNPTERFDIGENERKRIISYMKMLPRESTFPFYNPKKFNDSYSKFLVFGGKSERIPDNIRIYNKIGAAYGFLIDNALIEDTKSKVRFMLSAVIYVNKDEILNDDTYEYDSVGLPFMAELGNTILKHELKLKKKRGTKQTAHP